MGRTVLFGAVMGAVLLIAATTRSDVGQSKPTVVDDRRPLVEPLLGKAVPPAAGDETKAKDPFAPYDVGPPESVWPYESLTRDEQAIIDRGRDTHIWRGVHDAYGRAVQERSLKARGQAAQHLLGVDSIENAGVVP
jgi:hypothetical protein